MGVPEKTLRELAEGGGDAEALRLLSSAQRGRRLLLLRGVRDLTLSTGHPDAAAVQEAYELLVAAQETDREAAASVLDYPTVASWATGTALALSGRTATTPAALAPGRLAGVAAAAAIRSGLEATIAVPTVDGTLVLPSIGRTASGLRADGMAVVRSAADGAEVELGGRRAEPSATDGPGWEAVRVLHAEHEGLRWDVRLDDLDPDRLPGGVLAGERLTSAEFDQWQSTLDEAWALLVTRHREAAEATRRLITVLTPLSSEGGGGRSATSKEAIGNVGMSAPHDAHGFAVTLAHEVQHVKLVALLDLVPMTQPDDGRRYYAPWRPDPRPLSGLLQGAYAHLGIAGFWREERRVLDGAISVRAHTEFARWRTATARTLQTMSESKRLTECGELFVAEMARRLRAWCDEPVPEQALTRAKAAAERHRAQSREAAGLTP
ncbi:HEXXH motif domain-containing protein [Actinomadura luteofluorescens]|uniref:HEXXH motif domain-containing protein n=1 Tax=Actinomadura luteofluorescens TaxID=46163 RepID=UPI00346B82F7